MENRLRHGHAAGPRGAGVRSLTYNAWRAMKGRCTQPKDGGYAKYGAVGVVLCEAWDRFDAFLRDMGERPSAAHTIERLDNSKGYSPENCRWATRKEQARNRRSNRILALGGVEMPIAAWAEHLGMPAHRISTRLRRGWSVERALRA